MALALEFSSIDHIDTAHAMELQIIPPGPVFYTWTAIHGTTIFDGINNPGQYQGLNYVDNISSEADKLAKQGIPVLVIYTEVGMTQDQIQKMNTLFEKHSNIITMSIESDLKNLLPESMEIFEAEFPIQYLDNLRLAVISNTDAVFERAQYKASLENKPLVQAYFHNNNVQSIFYSDMDNQWLAPIPYIVAPRGEVAAPIMGAWLFPFPCHR